MNTQIIAKSKNERLIRSMSISDLQELSLIKARRHLFSTVGLTSKSIQDMVDKKILDDLFRFRTCCTDTIASR